VQSAGHTRRFWDKCEHDARDVLFRERNHIAVGLRPQFRSMAYRIAQKRDRKLTTKPGPPTIWGCADADGRLNSFMKRTLRQLDLCDVIQYSEKAGPTLLDLVTRTPFKQDNSCPLQECMVCHGNTLPYNGPQRYKRVLDCKQSDVVYYAHCVLCNWHYTGESMNPLNVRVQGHRYDADSAVYRHMNNVHGGDWCLIFRKAGRGGGNSARRRIMESFMEHTNDAATSGNDRAMLHQFWPPALP
jgi:hypothetical protein